MPGGSGGGGGGGGIGPKASATLVCTSNTAPTRQARINPFVCMIVRGAEKDDLMRSSCGNEGERGVNDQSQQREQPLLLSSWCCMDVRCGVCVCA